MTPDQIEAAAREVARLRGYDPDARADFPLPPAGAVWKVFRDEVERFAQVGTAIAAVMQRESQPNQDAGFLFHELDEAGQRRVLSTISAEAAAAAAMKIPRKRKANLPTREDLDAAMRKNADWMADGQKRKTK